MGAEAPGQLPRDEKQVSNALSSWRIRTMNCML